MSTPSRKKSWQPGRERVRLQAALAIQRENVTERLVRLREEVGHPEKPGESLPQDQAAARAGVTARQWQRWESGASIPYARNLSAVADAFGFDVAEFYDGPAGQRAINTPDPFDASGIAGLEQRIEELEREFRAQGDRYAELVTKQNALLSGQSEILVEIKNEQSALRELISKQLGAARQMEEAAAMLRAVDPLPPVPPVERPRTRRQAS